MPVLILPLFSTLIVGLAMVFVIGPPMKVVNTALTNWLKGMQTGQRRRARTDPGGDDGL